MAHVTYFKENKKGKKKAKKKLPSIASLEKKLWNIFSKWIRRRDCLRTTGDPAWLLCFTCQKRTPFNEAHAGHFVRRGCKPLKFEPQNVQGQCAYCNCYRDGEQALFLVELEKLYGRHVVDQLLETERLYKQGIYRKFTRIELMELIKYYQEKQ